MLKKLQIIFNVFVFSFLIISISKAELVKPNSNIEPAEVIKIQLIGLQKNDFDYFSRFNITSWLN